MNLETLRVIAFPGAPNLPTFAALENGTFLDRGLEVLLDLTPSSVIQAERVAAGEFDIAFTAFDNVVAYAQGGHVDPEYVAVMGATQLDVSLVVEPSIEAHSDLEGRPIALDALDTGFAFILYEMLDRAGVGLDSCDFEPVGATPQRWQAVRSGTHAATLTIEPFTTAARAEGFRILDSSTQIFDEYQGGAVAVRRSILATRPDAIQRFIAAYLESLAWVVQPENRRSVNDILVRHMSLDPAIVDSVLDSVLSPRSGLTPNAELLSNGVATVLRLRSRYGKRGVPDVDDVIDLSLWQAAMTDRKTG